MKTNQYISRRYYLQAAAIVVVGLATLHLQAAPYPDMPVSGPANVDLSWMDPFDPPINPALPVPSGAPQIAEWTRSNEPGDTMALTGEMLSSFTGIAEGRDTRFVIYGEGWPETDALIQRLDGRQCAITLPTDLPPNQMYLMWPSNDKGYGEPVAINQTEAWWIGPDRVTAGDSFSVYGRNLSLGGGVTKLYCAERDEWLTSTAQNPYKADFTVPGGWPNGTYTLWAHNGKGRRYGWADSVSIEVWEGSQFSDDSNTWINVKDATYGAVGDGVTDDYAAIHAAYIAAQSSPYSTIYFPPGSYAISDDLFLWTINSGLRLKGAGMDATTIFPIADVAPYPVIAVRKDNTYIEDLTVSTGDKDSAAAVYVENCDNSRFSNVRFSSLESAHGEHILKTLEATRVLFVDCEFVVSWTIWNERASGIIYDNCDFLGVHDCNVMLGGNTIRQSIYNCNARPYDESDASLGVGWCKGRWIGGSNYGANNWYIGDNISSNMRPRLATTRFSSALTSFTMMGDDPTQSDPTWLWMKVDVPNMPNDFDMYTDMIMEVTAGTDDHVGYWVRSVDPVAKTAMVSIPDWRTVPSDTTGSYADFMDHPDQNSSEQILFEGGDTKYRGSPVSTTSTSATFSNLSSYMTSVGDYSYVMVSKGKGLGQLRKIVSIASETINLDEPWRVEPDIDSVLMIGNYGCRWAVYSNYLDGVSTDVVSASSGFQFTGGGHSIVVDGNTFHETWTGISTYPELFQNFDTSINTVSPQYFCQYVRNKLSENRNAIASNIYFGSPSSPDPYDDMAMVGNVWRKNIVIDPVDTAFSLSSVDTKHSGLSVFDANMASNFVFAIKETGGLNNQIWVGNTFYGKGAGIGYEITNDNGLVLHSNTWISVGTKYGGTLPGSVLELPFRVVDLANPVGSNSVPIWNSGAALLNWSASTTNSWLKITTSSGLVLDEKSEDMLSFAINTDFPMPPVGSSAVVTVRGGGQLKQISVIYMGDESVSGTKYIYPLIDFSGRPLRAELRNGFTGELRTLQDLENTGELVLTDLTASRWYRLRVEEENESGNSWIRFHNEWFFHR